MNVDKSSEILKVNHLEMHFPIKKGFFSRTTDTLKAVNGISFSVDESETLGIVGESGCGKSTTGRAILRLINATNGEVIFENKNIYELNAKELRAMRRHMQIIFQDPFASLRTLA